MTDHELHVVEYKFGNFIRSVLLFHEFYFDVKDRRWCENRVADHLSRFEVKITYELEVKINDVFPDVQVFTVILQQIPWYVDFAKYIVCGFVLEELYF